MIENEGQIDDLIKKYHIDYLVAAIDHPRNIQSICYKAAKDNKVHFLQGGIGIDFGSYGVKADAPLQSSKYLKGPDVILGSFGPTNTIISAFMANDIIMSTLGLPTMLGGADELIIDFNSRKILKR
ncbi:hypothetical protein I2491_10040 [Levilactobacillus brevis]|nr:hypothetical protein [Levilactobacillus brevis]